MGKPLKMMTRSPVKIVAVAVFVCGLVNIFSVAQPPLPHRIAKILQLFPLRLVETLHVMTLLIGLALLIIAINLCRRKRNAYQLALFLSLASVALHLVKAIDYEEAIVSFCIAALLIVSKKQFSVKSAPFYSSDAIPKAIIAMSATFLYGSLGFWLLDRRGFGINFSIKESMIQTFQQIAFIDTGIIPKTRHARFFLTSLHWIAVVSALYFTSLLFRPIVFRFRTGEQERDRAKRIIEAHGHSPLDYFKYWPDKTFFFSSSGEGVISYGVHKGIALVLGDPVGPQHEMEETLRSFIAFCHAKGWQSALYQVQPFLLPLYNKMGLSHLKIGDEAIVNLQTFSLKGNHKKDLRHSVNKFEKEGYTLRFYSPPLSEPLLDQLESVSEDWLKTPGRRERTFTSGQFRRDSIATTPVWTLETPNGKIVAFFNKIPSHRKGEATIDLMRHRRDAPRGAMDYLFVKLFADLRQQGFLTFSLGMTPLSGFRPNEKGRKTERAIYAMVRQLNFIFHFKGLKAYKSKFSDIWEPRYLVYENILSLGKVAQALNKLTGAARIFRSI